jgi:hypothetical protein
MLISKSKINDFGVVAGLMNLKQAVGVIFGVDIGTTIIARHIRLRISRSGQRVFLDNTELISEDNIWKIKD